MAPTASTVAVMSIAAVVVVGQLYATIPLLDDLAEEFGVRSAAAAWASTAFGFAYALGMLVAGPLSDAVGRRRVAVAALLAGAAGAVLVTASPSFVLLLVTRVVQGAAAAFFPPVALAYLTERIVPHRRSTALTVVISAFLAAAVVAPLAALALSSLGGWRTWFHASAAGLVVLAVVLWRVMLPDARTHAGVRSSQMVSAQLAGLPRFLRQPQMITLYLATLSLMFTFVGITTLVQLAGPGSAHNPSVMQGVRVATLPALAIVPLAAAVLTKIPRPRRLGGAMILVSLAAAASGLAAGPLTLALALGMLTIAVAATAPALVETITQASPPDQRGGATALYGFALFVGASLAAPAATFASHMSYPSAAIGFAAIAALGTLCATLPTRATRTKPDALREPSE